MLNGGLKQTSTGLKIWIFTAEYETVSLTMASLKRNLAINTAVQVSGKVLATVIGVITLGVLTRTLEPSGYGDLTLVLTFISIFASLVDFGLTITTIQMISEEGADEERIIGNLVSLRTITAFFFLALAPITALAFPYSPAVKVGIAISALSYLLFSNSQLLVGIFQKRFIIWQPTLAEVLNRLTVLIGILVLPFAAQSISNILWIFVAGNVVHLALTLLFARRQLNLKPRFELAIWKDIASRSWPVGLSILFNLIYLRGDILFMSFSRGSEEIGLYGAAYKVVDVMTTIPVTFMGLALPILALAISKQDKDQFKRTMQLSFDFFAMTAVGFFFGALALGVPVMQVISGPEFSESGQVLKILGAAASIIFFGSLFGHAILAIHKQRVMTWGYVFVAAITITLYLALIPRYGMYAAAWITVLSEILITLITAICVYRVTHFIPNIKVLLKSLVAGGLMFAGLLALNQVLPAMGTVDSEFLFAADTVLRILGGIMIFGLALILMKGITWRDVQSLIAS